MWKMHEIREMIKLFEESSLQEMEIECEETDSKISLKKQGGVVVTTEQPVQVSAAPAVKPASPVAVAPAPAPAAQETKAPVQPAPAPAQPAPAERPKAADVNDPTLHKIVSPMVGTFYRAPAEDADPFVKPGDQVQKTTVVCIVEAMKLFNEIEAEVEGEIVDVLVENGQLVEHGQPLFLVRTK